MSTREHLIELFDILMADFGPQSWWPAETPFEVMVGAVLTQNTNWGNVKKAIRNLKQAEVLEPMAMHALPPEKLAQLIRPAGYYNIKAKRLKNLLDLVCGKYGGELSELFDQSTDDLRQELLAVKGIGPETADCITLYAAGKPVFVVDAYTFRILGRHGLCDETMGYFELQELIADSLESDTQLFNEYHALLVMLGKKYCKKSKPDCTNCPARDWAGGPEL